MDKMEVVVEHGGVVIEEQDISNDDNQQPVLIDFQEVITEDGTTMTQEILTSEEVDAENTVAHTAIEVMEIDDSQQEVSMVADTMVDKIEADMEMLQSGDSVPRIEITEANENEEIAENADEDTLIEEDTKKIEPDTEAVSEDELPSEAAAKVRF